MQFHPVTGSGAAVAYLDLGDRAAPTTVYLGGLGSATSASFTRVVGHPSQPRPHRHLLVDLIGSGWSDRDDTFGHTVDEHARCVASLLDALALREVTLVGHSLGGSIAISLAAHRPELVGRLVVAEPNLDPGVGDFSVEVIAYDEEAFTTVGHRAMVGEILARGRAGDVVAQQFARTLRRWSSRGLHRTAVSLLAPRPSSFRAQLAAFDGPRRYISGALSAEDLGPLRAIGCDVQVVPDAGHVLMTDNLDGFVAAILAP